jgi:hypothetical protein
LKNGRGAWTFIKPLENAAFLPGCLGFLLRSLPA